MRVFQPDEAYIKFYEKKKISSLYHSNQIWQLKHSWFKNKIRSFNPIGCPWKIRQFFWSLPFDYQIESPKILIDSISVLKRRFLYAFLLSKRFDDTSVILADIINVFHGEYSSSNHKNKLPNKIHDAVKAIKLKMIIDASSNNEEEFFDNVFLYACFNFFLQTLFWDDYEINKETGWETGEYLITKQNKQNAKDFFFEEFLKDINQSVKNDFLKFFDDIPIYYHRNLGFKEFVNFKEPFNKSIELGEIIKYRDVHRVVIDRYAGEYSKNQIAVNNHIGASKLLNKYSNYISDETKNFLRYEKEFKGEMSIVTLSGEFIDDDIYPSFNKRNLTTSPGTKDLHHSF